MRDEHKTKKQLIEELAELRNAMTELKESEKLHKKVKESLLVSEERYRTIFNTVPIAIWEYDFKELLVILENIKAQGITDIEEYFSQNPGILKELFGKLQLIDINNDALRMYGATTKEELFKQMGTHYTPESLGSFRDAMKAYEEGKTYHESDTVNETLDGRQIHVIMRIAFPGRGQLSNRTLITVTDITERKRAEVLIRALSSRLEAILSAVPEIIMEVDANRVYTWTNKAGYDFFGEDVLGKEASFFFEGWRNYRCQSGLVTSFRLQIRGSYRFEYQNGICKPG